MNWRRGERSQRCHASVCRSMSAMWLDKFWPCRRPAEEKRIMEFYWRRNVREALARLAEVSKTRSEWSPFSEFCDLMEQSLRKMDQDLRKQAFAKLAEFVASASVWEFERRREFVSCILEFYYIWGLGFAHPLKVQVIFPTLQQWREKEPENAEPSRWEGVLRHDRTLLAKAIGLCPGDQVARTEARRVHRLRRVGFGPRTARWSLGQSG